MTRLFLGTLTAVLLTAQPVSGPAWAEDPNPDLGRYQVIPSAMVPDQTGKPRDKTILLDTATGRTWVITHGKSTGATAGPLWQPLPVKEDETEATTGTAVAPQAVQETQAEPEPQRRRSRIHWDYENDP